MIIIISIETLREYYRMGNVFMTQHASYRCTQRSITQKDIRHCIMTGEIIEQYTDDFSYPSCLIFGYAEDNRIIPVVACDNGETAKIITVYIPDTRIFEKDLKARKAVRK